MTDATARDDGSDIAEPRRRRPGSPSIGASVTIVPAGDARLITGTLLQWQESGDGIGATVRATVDVAPTRASGGHIQVWATLHAAGGDIVVVSADATGGETPHALMLSGRIAAREPRRRSVRAIAHVPVDLTLAGADEDRLSGRTLDLSASGCRLSLEGTAAKLDAGEPTDVIIHLDRYNRPRVSGRVQAVRPGGQVVIRFDDVPGSVVEQIERYVYATLP